MQYLTYGDGTDFYAKTEMDTFVCSSGFGGLISATGIYEYKVDDDFEAGFYRCGKKVTSHKAGSGCSTSTD